MMFLLSGAVAMAQPQWRFHLAFEDATGAHDTIWLIWDETATLGSQSNPQVDIALGEGGVEMDLEVFNVWVYNWELDSTKTAAKPYSFYPHHSAEIHAFNYQFPMTIRWDHTMFTAGYLPDPPVINMAMLICDYFFWSNNNSWLQAYDMLLDGEVTVDGPEPILLFPLGVGITHGSVLSVTEYAFDQCWFTQENDEVIILLENVKRVQVISATGQLVLDQQVEVSPVTIGTAVLPTGLYFLIAQTKDDLNLSGKVLITH